MGEPLFLGQHLISLSTYSTLFAKSIYRKKKQFNQCLGKDVSILAINFKNKLKVHFSERVQLS